MPVSFKLNGKSVSVDVAPDTPLLWVLRDTLDHKGSKFGCGVGQCGACTVHRNGAAVRSCQLRISTLEGADIRTIEGLAPDGTHALQKAWEELDVPQCGYCQAGQIMSAAALLERNANPTDADIDNAMNGNICRCATYLRIRAAIKRAAEIKRSAASEQKGGNPGASGDAFAGAAARPGTEHGARDGRPRSLFEPAR
ncbi:MAG: (2Fe-2S)-binding protein [Gemmatimonadota bacterium]|nr:(2Fe-2S)-binding protein [Gemmatimonadota bacterium]